jgi:ATP phosphoribosyltransferase
MNATMPRQKFVLALPSKGRLQEQCINFLSGCGFDVRRVGNGREYVARMVGVDDVDVIFLRPEEIPSRVEQGDAHAGMTGEDLYREYGEGLPASSPVMPKLGFGGARLVVAVPQSWVDVASMGDLDEAAMLFHQRHGRSLRVATKFTRLTRGFFADSGITEYSLVESSGATEGAPASGVADFVVDLTSTGTTLAENHLKEIAGGTVLQTEVCLIASLRNAPWSPKAIAAFEHLVEQIEARIRATSQLVLRFSIPNKASASAKRELTEKYGCVVSTWSDGAASLPAAGRTIVVAYCQRSKLYSVVKFLKSSGSAGIIVDRGEFIFEGSSPAFERFKQALKGHDDGAKPVTATAKAQKRC